MMMTEKLLINVNYEPNTVVSYAYLGSNVSIMLPVAVTEIGVDVVGPWNAVYGCENDSGVIICYDVSVPIFRLVHFHVTMVPSELLSRFDRL